MKSKIISIVAAVFLTFIFTQNYMLSNMKIQEGASGSYTVSVFGGDFTIDN